MQIVFSTEETTFSTDFLDYVAGNEIRLSLKGVNVKAESIASVSYHLKGAESFFTVNLHEIYAHIDGVKGKQIKKAFNELVEGIEAFLASSNMVADAGVDVCPSCLEQASSDLALLRAYEELKGKEMRELLCLIGVEYDLQNEAYVANFGLPNIKAPMYIIEQKCDAGFDFVTSLLMQIGMPKEAS